MDWVSHPYVVQEFSHYCAPTVLAKLDGCTRKEAAERLLSIPGMTSRRAKGCVRPEMWYPWIAKEFGGVYEPNIRRPDGNIRWEQACRRFDQDNLWNYPSYADAHRYTVTQFLKLPSSQRLIVMGVHGHTLMAEDGMVVADTRFGSKKSIVLSAVFIDN